MKRITRGGAYYRVCKPDWTDCADTAHSRIRGGRWNAPGEYGVLYLNRTTRMAALQALENFRGEAHSLFDLRPERRPDLQAFDVASEMYVDVVTEDGILALGLPAHYPTGVDWPVCQPSGREAYLAGEHGIVCRSASVRTIDPELEELACFDRGSTPPPLERLSFDRWFPTGHV